MIFTNTYLTSKTYLITVNLFFNHGLKVRCIEFNDTNIISLIWFVQYPFINVNRVYVPEQFLENTNPISIKNVITSVEHGQIYSNY